MKKLLAIAFSLVCLFANAQGIKLSNFTVSAPLGTAAGTYETNPLVHVQQTTPGITITLPTPTDPTKGKNITISNIGTVEFTLVPGGRVTPWTGRIFRWDGANWVTAGGGGALSAIQVKNKFLASPVAADGYPDYRVIDVADLPSGIVTSEVDPLFNSKFATKTTDNLSEGATNTYFLNSRARSALSLTNIAAANATYNSGTGVFNIPNFLTAEVDPAFDTKLSTKTTDNLAEGLLNLYFTVARVRAALNSSTGAFTNTAPDQVVSLTGAGNAVVSGTYPTFVVTVAAPVISYPARTVNTNFTISTTRKALVVYTLTCSVTNPLLAGSSTSSAFLEYSLNAGSTWQPVSDNGNSSSVGVAVAIALTNGQTGLLVGTIETNALVRIRTTTTGTSTITLVRSQETQL